MKSHGLLLSLVALAACGGGIDTTLRIGNYKTTCTVATDCAAVFVGDPCTSACKCPNAAINTTDTLREASDLAAAEELCQSSPGTCVADCVSPAATCNNGVCALK